MFYHDFGSSSTDSEVVSVDVNVKIDAISWSPCQNFVFLALNSGQGQLVHIPTKVPLPSFSILDNVTQRQATVGKSNKVFSSCWIEKSGEEMLYSLMLLTDTGVVSTF